MMRKVIIFGNSGSGKSTLAKKFQHEGLAHLDLDTVAWNLSPELARKPIEESAAIISQFVCEHDSWVIEGCYADLIEIAIEHATEVYFMNLSVEQCIENAKKRPWEPHKYESKEAQDKNLSMLIDWIKQYPEREDHFSKRAHEQLFEKYSGVKYMLTDNRPLN